ncbi:hypothetical protein EDD37DRAFT_654991 [Exophiala viscosa]|uniref:uncharacterized protein n=1 Tax=Exophiala viscosa TaxID=2486360 RepID=UPI0021983505|nr:hypothetical protein EDD37DRAFT_654991 [Exophiala viscosa]
MGPAAVLLAQITAGSLEAMLLLWSAFPDDNNLASPVSSTPFLFILIISCYHQTPQWITLHASISIVMKKWALDHALEGRKDSALDICWELRLEPRIGVYRRAMVNLLIAQLLTYDQMKYAEECLDLLDILQQNNNGEVSDNVKNIISIAEDLIEELEVERLQTADASGARKIVIDPTTGLLSDPPSSPPTKDQQDTASNAKGDKDAEMKDVVGKGSGKSVRSDKSGSGDNDISMKSASGNSHSDHVSSQKDAGDNDRRVIYVYKTDKTEKDDVAADHNNTVTIEGMLRDSSHKPRVK